MDLNFFTQLATILSIPIGLISIIIAYKSLKKSKELELRVDNIQLQLNNNSNNISNKNVFNTQGKNSISDNAFSGNNINM